jgi:outer membrane protein OmpA-like peptidoglycan-associated protein
MRPWLSTIAAAVLLSPVGAAAQPRGTLDRFRAAPTPEDDFHVSRPNDLGHLRFGAQLAVDYALDPLVYEGIAGDSASELFPIVEHHVVGTLGVSLGLFDRVIVYGGLPVSFAMSGQSDPALDAIGVARADGAGLGDAYLGARVRLFGERGDPFGLALQATVTLPTSGVPDDSRYRGDPTATFLPMLIGELRPGGGVRIVLNLGARVREPSSATFVSFGWGHELIYAIGLGVPVLVDRDPRTHLDLVAQIYGDTAFDRFGQREGTALEATGGVRFFHSSGVVAGVAAGPGLARGFGTPDVRAIATLGWVTPPDLAAAAAVDGDRDADGVFDSADQCPDEPEDLDRFEDENGCPEPDNDRDGIRDTADQCPLEPETMNSWQDEDGCPDTIPDTDGDGIRDDTDQCVEQPEDLDEFEDQDGCPDVDNDRDGVVDATDRCPIVAGPVANEGCPDADRDGDTVVDRLDNCPDEPGPPENHGCRDRQRVVIEAGRLQILEMVFFRTNGDQILRRSHELLLNVARVLNAHPEIPRVVVEGHTDSRGNHDHNVDLSQRRAQSVVRFLTERGGVSPDRLEARGFGPDQPEVPNATTRDEHARNRRVEFRIPGPAGSAATGTDATTQ